MLRIHNSKRPRLAPRDWPTQQFAARKPGGLWWGVGGGWLDYVDARRPNRRSNGQHNFVLDPGAARVLTLAGCASWPIRVVS